MREKTTHILLFAAFVVAAVAGLVLSDETITLTGGSGGRAIDVTTTTNVVSFSESVRTISLLNSGSAVVYASVRTTAAQHGAMLAGTNAIPIPAGKTFEFATGNPYQNITFSAASGTNTVYVGAEK